MYSEVVREFCLTIRYYSPAAYRYLRTKFNKNLPPIRTLQYWYSSIESEPGFTDVAFETLRQKVETLNARGEQLKLTLFTDEMYIRKKAQWDHRKKEFTGFISCGTVRDEDEGIPIASNALVYMVFGNDFKLPIASFLINGLCTDQRAQMTKDLILRISETGSIVTGDSLLLSLMA